VAVEVVAILVAVAVVIVKQIPWAVAVVVADTIIVARCF
jgi:hypothetical protein